MQSEKRPSTWLGRMLEAVRSPAAAAVLLELTPDEELGLARPGVGPTRAAARTAARRGINSQVCLARALAFPDLLEELVLTGGKEVCVATATNPAITADIARSLLKYGDPDIENKLVAGAPLHVLAHVLSELTDSSLLTVYERAPGDADLGVLHQLFTHQRANRRVQEVLIVGLLAARRTQDAETLLADAENAAELVAAAEQPAALRVAPTFANMMLAHSLLRRASPKNASVLIRLVNALADVVKFSQADVAVLLRSGDDLLCSLAVAACARGDAQLPAARLRVLEDNAGQSTAAALLTLFPEKLRAGKIENLAAACTRATTLDRATVGKLISAHPGVPGSAVARVMFMAGLGDGWPDDMWDPKWVTPAVVRSMRERVLALTPYDTVEAVTALGQVDPAAAERRKDEVFAIRLASRLPEGLPDASLAEFAKIVSRAGALPAMQRVAELAARQPRLGPKSCRELLSLKSDLVTYEVLEMCLGGRASVPDTLLGKLAETSKPEIAGLLVMVCADRLPGAACVRLLRFAHLISAIADRLLDSGVFSRMPECEARVAAVATPDRMDEWLRSRPYPRMVSTAAEVLSERPLVHPRWGGAIQGSWTPWLMRDYAVRAEEQGDRVEADFRWNMGGSVTVQSAVTDDGAASYLASRIEAELPAGPDAWRTAGYTVGLLSVSTVDDWLDVVRSLISS